MLPDLFGLPRSPRPRAASSWTEKRLRYLRRRWSQGARAREIGAELGVTANAVIAKIHRLGIARLSPYGGAPGRRLALQNIPRAARPQYARRRAVSLRRARPASRLLQGERDVENARLDAQIPLTQRRSLFALSDHTCRWPVGEPASPSFFCGGEVLRNKPYCAVHCARAYRRPRDGAPVLRGNRGNQGSPMRLHHQPAGERT
jgi:GcrA cell cycle regulator